MQIMYFLHTADLKPINIPCLFCYLNVYTSNTKVNDIVSLLQTKKEILFKLISIYFFIGFHMSRNLRSLLETINLLEIQTEIYRDNIFIKQYDYIPLGHLFIFVLCLQ